MAKQSHTNIVKQLAKTHGFDSCGISKAEYLENEAPKLEKWLSQNYQGEMAYMANHFDKRLDPRKLVHGAKSVISLLLNYFPEKQLSTSNFKISKYAYGRDYHKVIKKKLKLLVSDIQNQIGEIEGRIFVDSAPVMDKVWAQKSGIGWVGKHSNLITRELGSCFFIAEIISDLALVPDLPINDYCGTCTKCIDACPTDAIVDPYVVDGSKCISYFTIELKDKQIPDAFKGKMDNWIFGCDICQDVCPWNRFSQPHQTQEFQPNDHLEQIHSENFVEMTEEIFDEVFQGSAVKRTGYKGLKRNIEFVKQ